VSRSLASIHSTRFVTLVLLVPQTANGSYKSTYDDEGETGDETEEGEEYSYSEAEEGETDGTD
jgi:hypothetical protein